MKRLIALTLLSLALVSGAARADSAVDAAGGCLTVGSVTALGAYGAYSMARKAPNVRVMQGAYLAGCGAAMGAVAASAAEAPKDSELQEQDLSNNSNDQE